MEECDHSTDEMAVSGRGNMGEMRWGGGGGGCLGILICNDI